MDDEPTGITLTLLRDGRYLLSLPDHGEDMVLTRSEWVGVVALADKWREDV